MSKLFQQITWMLQIEVAFPHLSLTKITFFWLFRQYYCIIRYSHHVTMHSWHGASAGAILHPKIW